MKMSKLWMDMSEPHTNVDNELMRVLTKAVDELGLEWSSFAGWLDECYLQSGCRQKAGP